MGNEGEKIMALTAKQALFVEYYLESFNATQAATQAGYSGKTAHNIGWQNVRKLEIQEALTERVEFVAMSANERLIKLSEIARDKEQKTADRLKAIEMLGKLAGDYVQKVETAGDDTIRVVVRYADDDGG